MRFRLALFLVLVPALALFLAVPDAWARGGRFNGPAAARGPAGPSSEGGEPDSGEHAACPQPPPTQQPDLPTVDNVAPGVGDSTTTGRRSARSGRKSLGLSDWSYWYEANREEFEDLRRGPHLTEDNPLFALGAAIGARAARPDRRLDEASLAALRGAVRRVVTHEDEGHWVYTEGAALVALGKIARDAAEVEYLYKALAEASGNPQYVRESAALGLGQLRRTEERRQLPGTTLDRARLALLATLNDAEGAVRTRAFAAVSLGMLADQPTAAKLAGGESALALLQAWTAADLPDETQVGILVGLGLHRPEDIGSVVRLALASSVARGKVGSRSQSALVRAHAALALAHLGSANDAPVLARALAAKRETPPILRQGLVIAAGVLGARLPAARPGLGDALLGAGSASKDPATRNLVAMALGRLLAADVSDGRDDVAGATKAGAHLVAAARKGMASSRTFAALALALAVRDVDERIESAALQDLRVDAIEALRAGHADRGLDGHARAAFATALGIARDAGSSATLLVSLQDEDGDPALRAYAALALGLIGDARVEVVRAVADALRDARSDSLRVQATTALGLLGGGKKKDRERTIAILIEQLRVTRNQYVKGQIAITLARIGDARAVEPLVAMLAATSEPHTNRSMACAALGLLGDEETTPVLSAARRDSHYLSGSGVVFELLDVL